MLRVWQGSAEFEKVLNKVFDGEDLRDGVKVLFFKRGKGLVVGLEGFRISFLEWGCMVEELPLG